MIRDQVKIEEIKMLCKEVGDYPHLDVDLVQLEVLHTLIEHYLRDLDEMNRSEDWNRPIPYTD